MNQLVKFGIGFSIIIGIVLFSGTQERFSAWADDGICKSYEDDPYNLLEIYHGGVEDTPILGDKEEIPGAFTTAGSEGFTWMKLIVCKPTDPDTSPEDTVEVTVENGTFLNDAGDGLGTILRFRIAEMPPATVFRVKGETPSQHVGDIEICAKLASDESGTCRDPVKATAVSIAWIDDEPDYARDAAEYEEGEYTDNGDSDNFFLRHLVRPHKDDGTPDYSYAGAPDYQDIDLWYRIIPEDLRELDEVVNRVRISIYREDTSEIVNTIEVDQDKSLEKFNEEYVYHVVWDGAEIRNPVTGEFTVAGFYRVQLKAEFDWGSENGEPVTLTTSIKDGDTELPGWQCPQDGLAIHDLAFKHRPDIYVGSNEKVAPNGPVYPFSPDILEKYRLYKETVFGGGPAWEEPLPNYYTEWPEDGTGVHPDAIPSVFPLSASIHDSSYEVLEKSRNKGEEEAKKHYIDLRNPLFKVTSSAMEKFEEAWQKGELRDIVWEALKKLVFDIFTDDADFRIAIWEKMHEIDDTIAPGLFEEEEALIWRYTGTYIHRDCANGLPYLLHWGRPYDGTEKTHPNYVFIQYWQYSTSSHAPYKAGLEIMDNEFNHEGEWEMVQIALRLRDPETSENKARWLLPYAATAAQHYYGQTLAWRLDKDGETEMADRGKTDLVQEQRYVLTSEQGARVKIYIAENSHATYFRTGRINANILNQKAGIQDQYKQVSEYYDKISGTPPERIEDYKLLTLDDFEGAGIYDWPGYWGLDVLYGGNVRGPKFSETEDLRGNRIIKAADPVGFYNSCRKLVDGNGNFDPDGEPDQDTELQ